MRVEYFFDGIPLCQFGAGVSSFTGLFSKLVRKEPERVDYADQHGYLTDRTAIRFQHRVIELSFYFIDCDRQQIRDNVRRLLELVSTNIPVRLMRIEGHRVDVWDVDLISENSSNFLQRAAQLKFTFHETAPVKVVYKCNTNTANLTINSANPLMVSWGDNVEERAQNGGNTHEYTDGRNSHYIIISGVISGVKITTNMQQVCEVSI
jgi:hypothetical protein